MKSSLSSSLIGRLVGAFRNSFQANTPAPSDDFWYNPVGAQSSSGIVVTPDIALKAAALWACVKILAETIATMPLAMFRELPDGSREPAPSHPLDEIIRFQPNQIQSAIEFWETVVLHAVTRGTGYAEIVPGQRGAVDQLLPIHPSRLDRPKRLPGGSLAYRLHDPEQGTTRVILQEELFRVPGLSSDGVNGIPAVDLAADDIGLGMAADQSAGRLFSNRLNVGGFLIHPGKLSSDAQKALIARLVEGYAGANNSHRPLLLQEGMQFKEATMTGEQAQLIEARKWQITLIAMRWRIPLKLLGLESSTATSEQDSLNFIKYTIRPWARRIEQAIRRDLIIAKGTFVAKYNMDALLRGDMATRATYFQAALGSGGSPAWMTQNEVRKIEGLPPNPDERANTLGVGTNPDTSTPASETSITQLINKHIVAIRKANQRFADNNVAFARWVSAFFGGEISHVMKTLDISKEVAREYCEGQRLKVIEVCSDETKLERLLQGWEDDGPRDLIKTLGVIKNGKVEQISA